MYSLFLSTLDFDLKFFAFIIEQAGRTALSSSSIILNNLHKIIERNYFFFKDNLFHFICCSILFEFISFSNSKTSEKSIWWMNRNKWRLQNIQQIYRFHWQAPTDWAWCTKPNMMECWRCSNRDNPGNREILLGIHSHLYFDRDHGRRRQMNELLDAAASLRHNCSMMMMMNHRCLKSSIF